ncbi:unnamed protein product [Leptidea sinapis]|uniref:Uncharacterized protein n=1 Tax=Leptidea sinapis TaxID=189913 RepID=A0A5E4R1B6_9NEOP|nr:unnamed protein product [Leptidea sinapis]
MVAGLTSTTWVFTSVGARAAASTAEDSKRRKYVGLSESYIFVPFGVETLGPWGPEARRIYFGQRISLAIQRGNAATSPSIGILGLEISSDWQFHGHLEGKVKLASKKLGVINRARQYFKPAHILALYKAQVRPHMEYCCHLWSGAPQAARIVGDTEQCSALRRDVAALCVFYRIYHGECTEELLNDIIPTIWMCGGLPQCGFQAFFHVLQSCGMNFLVRFFRDDTTWVPSKRARTPSLKAGNTPVIPLVLQEIVGGGDHLTTGDPYARLSNYSIN